MSQKNAKNAKLTVQLPMVLESLNYQEFKFQVISGHFRSFICQTPPNREMEIITARFIREMQKEILMERQTEIAVRQIETPNVILHAGPRIRYNDACRRFVALHLERTALRAEKSLLSDPTMTPESLFSARMGIARERHLLNIKRKLFCRRREEVAMERRSTPNFCCGAGNQMRYDEARKRFAEVHALLLSSRKKKQQVLNKKE
jgi:hypothetical protein